MTQSRIAATSFVALPLAPITAHAGAALWRRAIP